MSRFVAITVLLVPTLAWAAVPAQNSALLPQSFAGWKQTATAPLQPSGDEAAVLKEYGLADAEEATYARGSARLTLRAWRFQDATGALGAYTFERQPGMHLEKIGRGGAINGPHAIFWAGATVVQADFAGSLRGPARDEAGALRALAAKIPAPGGGAGVAPPLLTYLPLTDYVDGTVHYALGPAGYAHSGSVVPVADVDFSQDAEVLTAEYAAGGGRGKLTLIMYPTPQIAAAHLKAIEAQTKAQGLQTKRSGPLLAVLSGNLPPQAAKKILDAARVHDTVTINHPEGYESEAAKLAHLLLGIAALTGVLLAAAILLGLFLGGGRALVRRLQGKPASAVTDEEFISLHLE